MNVAILGAGGVGLGLAALLRRQRDGTAAAVRLWGPSAAGLGPLLARAPLRATGAVEGAFAVHAGLDLAAAVEGADLVIVAAPANAHRALFDALAERVSDGQVVAISAQLSLGALYLSRKLAARGVQAPVCALATSPTTGRRTAPGAVHVSAVRGRIVAAALGGGPAAAGGPGAAAAIPAPLTALLGEVFVAAPDLLSVTLANVNPANHLAIALCNLTRMEHGEAWGTWRGISGAVGRLIEALDAERLALAARFGCPAHSVRAHLQGSYGLPLGAVAEMAAEQDRRRGGAADAPARLDHRYVTEDVPFGIVPLLALADLAGIDLPLHRAGLTLINALYGRDFAAENDLLPALGLARVGAAGLLELCQGAPAPPPLAG